MLSVARRAMLVRLLLRVARTLWVDDSPSNNLYERTVLSSLDIAVNPALSTDEALYMAAQFRYDIILTDMNRTSNSRADLDLLAQLKSSGSTTSVLFYVGQVDQDRSPPAGAFASTNRPDELLHYVFDVLERRHYQPFEFCHVAH